MVDPRLVTNPRLFRVAGIDVRLHWTFLFLLPLLLLFLPGGIWPILSVVALFAIVLLHELGHSFVAQSFGLRVVDITLWPLGGLARMSEIPENTRIETLIAIAGPLVNFALASVGLVFMADLADVGSVVGARPPVQDPTRWALAWFVFVNLAMGTFNLVPAFPMDGGRILRAILGRNGDWVGATERAVQVGRIIAIGMAVATIAWGLPCSLLLIAVFVWIAGSHELLAVRLRHARSPFPGFPFFAQPEPEPAWGAPPPPPPADAPTGGDPRTGARRPEVLGGKPKPRLTDEELRKLEQYRGPLRRFLRDDEA